MAVSKIYSRFATLSVVALSPFALTANVSAQSEEDVFELSPFTVEAGQDTGYRATSTLAGTRLNTQLKDIGSAISVITDAVFEDTGATDAETILSYGLNTEVAGVNGNFADGLGDNHNGRAEQDQQRLNPQGSQRVRGLAEASLTRNFFLTDIPFDGYNTDRLDISRGANSLLFGVGAPGGVINNGLHQASVDGGERGEFSIRIGERNSHRETVDYHTVLVEDRLALRVSGLYEDTVFKQRPAYEIDKRAYAAFDSVLFENENSNFLGRTKLRGNVEVGSMKGTPPNIVPPTDGFSSFFVPPDIAALSQVPGVVIPGYYTGNTPESRYHPDFGYTEWRPKQTYDTRLGVNRGNVPAVVERPTARQLSVVFPSVSDSTPTIPTHTVRDAQVISGTASGSASGIRTTFEYLGTGSFFMGNRNGQSIPNFTTPVILDKGVWDNDNEMLQGSTNRRSMSFDAFNLTLEQPMFGNKGGLEIAFDEQSYKQEARIPFSQQETVGDSGNGDVVIDISEYLGDGTINPNLGRPMLKQDQVPTDRFSQTMRDAVRATFFYRHDFADESDNLGWLGDHTFTAFYNEQNIENFTTRREGKFSSSDVDIGASNYQNHALNGGRRNTNVWVYLGPSVLNMNSPSEVEIERLRINLPEEGDSFSTMIWNTDTDEYEGITVTLDSILASGNRRKQVLDTNVLSWQGRFWNDNIVALYGWRKDESETFENIGPDNAMGIPQRLPTGEINPDYLILEDEAGNPAEGQTQTASLVFHAPEEWLGDSPFGLSFHVSESENFQPSGTRRDILGNVLSPPNGTTEELGFTVRYNDWLTARFNWFETTSSAASTTINPNNAYSWVLSGVTRWDEARDLGWTIDEALVAAGGEAGMYPSYEAVFEEVLSWLPQDLRSLRNPILDPVLGTIEDDPNPGQTATRDFVAEGFEAEIIANITDNWRFMINVGQQESVQSNTALVAQAVAKEVFANINASDIGDLLDSPARAEGQTFASRYNALVIAPYASVAARDNTTALELREWRTNVITTYDFTEGLLKGSAIGGAIRHQTKNAVGYQNTLNATGDAVPDVSNPFFGPAQTNGDLWISHSRPILNERFDWKIQLNYRNAFGDNDPIPVVINPDGALAVVRNANPREVFLTNTFRF